ALRVQPQDGAGLAGAGPVLAGFHDEAGIQQPPANVGDRLGSQPGQPCQLNPAQPLFGAPDRVKDDGLVEVAHLWQIGAAASLRHTWRGSIQLVLLEIVCGSTACKQWRPPQGACVTLPCSRPASVHATGAPPCSHRVLVDFVTVNLLLRPMTEV